VKRASAHVVPLRDYLSEHWITAVAAFLHLLGWGEHHHNPTGFGLLLIVLSICVPAIGGAVHGIRTQSEFRRRCQRYQRMAGLLRPS
jgi:hypothetical protein